LQYCVRSLARYKSSISPSVQQTPSIRRGGGSIEHYLLEIFSEILPIPTREGIFVFCRDNSTLAIVIAYVLLAVIGTVLASHGLQALRLLRQAANSPGLMSLMGCAGIVGIALSIVSIFYIKVALAPVPEFKSGQREFIREPVVLNWAFAGVNESGVYQYQNASTADFKGVLNETTYGTSFYSYSDEGEGARWWRVRANLENGGDFWSGWSRPVQTTRYSNAYSRIKGQGQMLIYVTSEIEQGIFRFLDPDKKKLIGADVDIADEIANTLTSDLHKEIKTRLVPVPFTDLLRQPRRGNADIIISSITKLSSRESDYDINFSQPYFCTGQSLIYRKADWPTDVSIREMLKGKTVGYKEGTTSEKLVAALVAELGEKVVRRHQFNGAENMVKSLLARTSGIQLIVTDTPFALDSLQEEDKEKQLVTKQFSASDFPASIAPDERGDQYAVAVAQGEEELLEAVNRTIANLKRDRKLDVILEKAALQRHPKLSHDLINQLYASNCPD
jgi:ABC-type amino acid transport substrate-binding protein